MALVVDPKKTYVSVAIFCSGVVFVASMVWWMSAAKSKLDQTAEAVKPIPQMQQDIALIKQALEAKMSIASNRE